MWCYRVGSNTIFNFEKTQQFWRLFSPFWITRKATLRYGFNATYFIHHSIFFIDIYSFLLISSSGFFFSFFLLIISTIDSKSCFQKTVLWYWSLLVLPFIQTSFTIQYLSWIHTLFSTNSIHFFCFESNIYLFITFDDTFIRIVFSILSLLSNWFASQITGFNLKQCYTF